MVHVSCCESFAPMECTSSIEFPASVPLLVSATALRMSTQDPLTPMTYTSNLRYSPIKEAAELTVAFLQNQLHQMGSLPTSSKVDGAKSVAPDGFPPHFLKSGWEIYTQTPKTYELGEALGINTTLRACLPNFDSPVVAGKWSCPFMFVKDGNLKYQMKQSLFYEMTLEQRWEKIFACENNISSQGNSVIVEAEVQREVVFVGEREAVWDENRVSDGVVWFRGSGGVEEVNIGLSSLIVDRMKWEEERGGWGREENRQVKVKRTEEFGGIGGGWSKFGCYVLVERFVLKRMDGSVV